MIVLSTMNKTVAALVTFALVAVTGACGDDRAAPAATPRPQSSVLWQATIDPSDFENPRMFVHEIGDDHVMLGGSHTVDGEPHRLVGAVDRSSGVLLWAVDAGGEESGTATFHTVRRDVFVVGNSQAGSVQAFALEDGALVWEMGGARDVELHGDFVVFEDAENPGGATGFHSADIDVILPTELEDRTGVYSADTGELVHTRLFDDILSDAVALGHEDGSAVLLDPQTGTTISEIPGRMSIIGSDELDPPQPVASLLNWDTDEVVGVDVQTGEVLWSQVRTGPVATAKESSVVVFVSDGDVELVDAIDGASIESFGIAEDTEDVLILEDVIVTVEGEEKVRPSNADEDHHPASDFFVNRLVGYDIGTGDEIWKLDDFDAIDIDEEDGGSRLGTTEYSLRLDRLDSGDPDFAVLDVQLIDILTGSYLGQPIPADRSIRIIGNIGLWFESNDATGTYALHGFDGSEIAELPGPGRTVHAQDGLLVIISAPPDQSGPTTLTTTEWSLDQ